MIRIRLTDAHAEGAVVGLKEEVEGRTIFKTSPSSKTAVVRAWSISTTKRT